MKVWRLEKDEGREKDEVGEKGARVEGEEEGYGKEDEGYLGWMYE